MIYAQGSMVDLVLSVKQADYSKIEAAIKAVGGKVNFTHKLVDGMAVTLPDDQAADILKMPEVIRSQKDYLVSVPEPPKDWHEGYNIPQAQPEVQMDDSKAINTEELKKLNEGTPNTYYPYTNGLTRTNEFYNLTGHFGEKVIVAVIDAGISSAATSVANRIIGGEDFTGDGLSATSPMNGPHGTWVAGCIGANIMVRFSDYVTNAIKRYAPSSVVPGAFGPGTYGIPLVGQAPSALFYALKVFPYNSNSSPRSRIAAAMERAIELKEKYNCGGGAGLNIRIINMSLGGAGLFSGNDDIYAPLVKRAHDAGILMVISAGNDGPSGMTIGEPGAVPNVVTCGSANDATHERILYEYVYASTYGAGIGAMFRPLNNNIVSDYSSRGPNADGRPDPDIVAPGDWRFVQGPTGTTFSWVSGTSFAAPTVAGAAALLISACPAATPDQLRAALLWGANNTLLNGNPTVQDQGFGFLDVYNAYCKLTSGVYNPPDAAIGTNSVVNNILKQCNIQTIPGPKYSASTGMLLPGQRVEYFLNVPRNAKKVIVSLTGVTAELPYSKQNQIYGDDILFAIHSSELTTDDYRCKTPVFVQAGSNYYATLEGLDMSMGIMRITLMGDWQNAGKISASISVQTEYYDEVLPFASGLLSLGEKHRRYYNVMPGLRGIIFKMDWPNGWDKFPANDLDMVVYDPSGKPMLFDRDNNGITDGQGMGMPEMVRINSPKPGRYTIQVVGYSGWKPTETFVLYADCVKPGILAKPVVAEKEAGVPTDFALAQNMPNPFNPTTVINYDLPQDANTTLRVYNSLGQLVRTLVNETRPAGSHSVLFDGKDESGRQLASGMYIYQITAGSFVKSAKMMLLK